ncbi:MAG: iron ABC transporter permease [Acidimicrobiales bacterium]|nr:iron ABC transporter permease [Acidimicrobiales bacterium]
MATSRLAVAVLIFMTITVGYPVFAMVRRFADLGSPGGVSRWSAIDAGLIGFTIGQAVASTALTLAIGLPLAHVLARYRFAGQGVVEAATLVPFILPTVVVAVAVQRLLSPLGVEVDGINGSLIAILVAHVVFNVSVVVRIVGGYWRQLDIRPNEAAALLGAAPWTVFRRVTFPRIAPAILAAAAVVFFFTFTSFGVIVILGGLTRATLETEIYRYAILRNDFGSAAVLAVIQAVAVAGLALVNQRLQKRLTAASSSSQAILGARPIGSLAERVHATVVVSGTLLFLLAPLLSLAVRSFVVDGQPGFGNYTALLDRPAILVISPARAVLNSILFAALAALLAALIGTTAALAAQAHGRLAHLTEIAVLVPLGISAVTLGFGYLVGFTFGDLRSSPILLITAHAVIGIPFVVAAVLPALRNFDGGVLDAAALLGAPPRRVLTKVALPILRPALVAGAGFAAAVSLGEFGASGFLARSRSSLTAPQAVFGLLGQPAPAFQGQAAALCVVLGLLVIALVLLIDRGRGSLGRSWL